MEYKCSIINEKGESVSEADIAEYYYIALRILKNVSRSKFTFYAERRAKLSHIRGFDITVLLTSNEGIQELNRDKRNIDSPTDVLSFPMLDLKDASGNVDFNAVDPCTGLIHIGDICISVDKMKEQAQLYGHSERREIAFLITHSVFHLFGYDHMTDEEDKRMVSMCEKILSDIGVRR